MALGVRSYGNTLLTQNLFVVDNLPDKLPVVKNFARKILEPTLECLEADCGTTIGRLLQVPEASLAGLIRIDNNKPIQEEDIFNWIREDIYTVRVRDTSSCLSEGGFCRKCGTGFNARVGEPGSPGLGELKTFTSSPRSFQNYIAGTYSGSIMGWQSLSADPLPIVHSNWTSVTSHSEMDGICRTMGKMGIGKDDYDYLFTVDDLLERALLIIGTYGVYGNA